MLRMHRLALKAIAKLTRIDIRSAEQTTRQNPILESEIHIEEELINLQESLDTYYTAGDTLRSYPKIRSHFLQERESILKHCIGLVERMLHGRKLPYSYTAGDVDHAIKRLVQMVVEDSRRTGRRIDRDIMDIFLPFMTVRQRVKMREWGMDLVVQASQLPKVYSIGNAVMRRAHLS
jgi:hypothetical protein